MMRGFSSQGNFGTIHTVNARIAARSGLRGNDRMAGKKTHLHQPAGVAFGKIDAVQNASFAAP